MNLFEEAYNEFVNGPLPKFREFDVEAWQGDDFSDPFVYHLHVAFFANDGEKESNNSLFDLYINIFKSFADQLAKESLVEFEPLPIVPCGYEKGIKQEECTLNPLIPVRLTNSYDIRQQGIRYVVDLKYRKAGDYY